MRDRRAPVLAAAAVCLVWACAEPAAGPAVAQAASGPAAAPGEQAAWRSFQQAVARGDREAVAALTAFPFEGRSRAAFIADYDRILRPGVRRQVVGGTLYRVTQADAAAAAEEELDLCGAVGDYVVEPSPAADVSRPDSDDELFTRLVFKRTPAGLRLYRTVGCS